MLEYSKINAGGATLALLEFPLKKRDACAELAMKLCDRDRDIDAVAFYSRSAVSDVGVAVFARNGQPFRLCGSAVCAIGKYIFEARKLPEQYATVDTDSGIKEIRCRVRGGSVYSVDAEMGRAALCSNDLPSECENSAVRFYPIKAAGRIYDITALSIGSPYAVIFVEENLDRLDLASIGGEIEHDSRFPEGTSVLISRRIGKDRLAVRIWLRGVGEVKSSGSAACAAAVASVLCGLCDFDTRIIVELRTGEVEVICDRDFFVILGIYMTGPIEKCTMEK